jgi:type I restriction enzyme S subunit
MDGFCTTEIIPIDFKGKVIPQFARYVLMSPEFLDYTAQCGYGVKMPRLGTNDAKKATFPLPPLAVQQQIVAQIKTLFAEIDRIEQSRQRLLQTAKLAKQKVLAELLNNDEWGRVKLEEVGQVVTGSTPSKSNHDFYGNDYPFFKPTDLDAGINTIKASDNLSKEGFDVSRKLPKESILVCCIGSIGKTGMIQVEGTCNQQINAIIPNQNLFLPKFLFYICLTDDFQKQLWENASATTIAILNKGNFEKLLIPLLPLSVQRQIVSKIESIFAEIDKIERAVKN